ncbi:fimbrial protein [Salmonella enterica subsp. enterica serovar Oslo]|nr:fimbrial protein [Salmonella enterica subsp. enterica serovar Oslo]
MKIIIPVIVLLSIVTNVHAKTADTSVAIKASVTGATCTIIPTPTEINFNTMTAGDIGNNRISAKEVNLALNCDWIAKQVKVTFTPTAGTVAGNTSVMRSGKMGLGFKLQFANTTTGKLTDTPFGVAQTWASTTTMASPYGLGGKIALKPFYISGEDITAGNVDTSLALSIQYD